MAKVQSVAHWMQDLGVSLDELVTRSSLDKRIVEKIVGGKWTPSPSQRQRVAAALGVELDAISWEHSAPVEHIYGHGPQFGRSP